MLLVEGRGTLVLKLEWWDGENPLVGGEKELDIDTIENDSFWMGRGHEILLVSRHFVSVAMNEYGGGDSLLVGPLDAD